MENWRSIIDINPQYTYYTFFLLTVCLYLDDENRVKQRPPLHGNSNWPSSRREWHLKIFLYVNELGHDRHHFYPLSHAATFILLSKTYSRKDTQWDIMNYNLQETGHWCIRSQTFVKWVSLQLHLVLVLLETITVIRGSLAKWILKMINIHRIEGQSRRKPFLLEKKIRSRISLRQDHQRQNQSQGLHLVPDPKGLMYSLRKYSPFIRPTYFAWFDKLRNTQDN